jgi:hypothetical protein
MLKTSPDDSFRVAWDKRKWDTKKREWVVVKVYGSYSSPRTIFENMGNNGAANWGYEFITAGKRCKIHLDYDGYGVKDGNHSTIRRMLKELRAFFKDKFGMDRLQIYVWCGSRETDKGWKISYHVVIDHLHVANNEVLWHLFKAIWPNEFLVPRESKSGIDTGIFTQNRNFRLPGCAKYGDDVPLHLITKDPSDDDLSPTALPDPGFTASLRSLITVIDSDSTLLPFKFEAKKRKRVGEEQTSAGRASHRQKVAPRSDAAISPGKVDSGKADEVALTLVRTHPRIGSVYDEWFKTLCAIINKAGHYSEVALLAIEYSRIREGFQGASDVEGRFYGLQLRESGRIVTMGSLVKWANENPALVFATNENASGLGAVEDPGANKVWVNKTNQTLRWADTEVVSWRWLVQLVSYLVQLAELQMRAWIQQYYPHVSDDEFKTVWCIETRSEFYEEALKTYVNQKLEEIGAPQGKRARTESGSGKEAAGSKQKSVWQDPKAVAPPSGKGDERGDERGAGAGCKGVGASSTSKHCTAKQDSLCWMEEDAASSSHAVEPGVQDSEPVSDASLIEEAPAPGTCLSSSLEPVTAAAATRPSPAAAVITTAPVIECGVEHGVQDCEQMSQDDEPMVEGCEHGDQDLEQMSQDGEPGVEGCEHGDQDDEQMSQDGEPGVQGAAQESDPTVQVYDFENLSTDNRAKVTKHIEVKHLSADMIDPRKDCFIQSGYKTAKSHATHEYITQNNLSVLSIVNLRSLKDGFLEKFAGYNVLSYDDPKFYENFKPGRSVVITLDSLFKLESVDFQAKDYVVYLDELHSLMTYLSGSTTLADKRILIWPLFARILKNAKQIIGVDNDLCDVALDFILKTIQRNKPYEFIMNHYKSYGGVRATEVPTMDGMEMKMYQRMCDNVGFTTCFNSRKQAKRVFQALKERCEKDGMDTAKMKLFTSKEGVRITDINEQWGDGWVFYSPVIVTGRDYKPEKETDTFCWVDGTQSLSPEECVQQLARNRNMKHLYYHLSHVTPVTPHFKTEGDIKECFNTEMVTLKAMSEAMNVYRQVCDKRVSACGDACEMGENVYTDIVCKVAHRRHLMACNFRHHFIKILTKTGFQLEESDTPSSGYGKKKIKRLDQGILEEKERKIDAFIEKISAGVPVSKDDADVFEADAARHVEILQLPRDKEVIIRFKDEVFDEEPFKQHLNVRRLTLSKEVRGNDFKVFIDGDRSFNSPEAPRAKVAIFCELIRRCVPDCRSFLGFQVTLGSKDEVPIPTEVLKLWEMLVLNPRLKAGEKTQIPKNKKKLIQSLIKKAKDLFGDVCLDTTYPHVRRNGKRYTETCYTVNSEWVERQMELFRHSAHTQRGKLDVEIAHLYGLLGDIDYSNPNKDATEQIHVCEPMDCSNTLENPELEQKRSELWADHAQQTLERQASGQKKTQASGQKKPKRAQVSEEDRLKKMRANLRRCGVKPDF